MKQLEIMVIPLLAAAAGMYLLAWFLLLRRRARAGFGMMGLAWLVNAGLVILNGLASGEPPLGNMYHVQVVLSLCFLPLYALLARRYALGWTASYFAFVSALPLVGALFMEKQVMWRRVPALQSPWFVPHVTAYVIGYALAAVAFAMTAAGAVGARLHKSTADARYVHAARQTVRLAFPFLTFGMLSGALWAEQAWGQYWSWDPKETWSLITWTLYLIYLHCQTRPDLRRYAFAAHILAFCALLTTFFLVNLLPRLASVLHGYA